jgi:hypothetical protein
MDSEFYRTERRAKYLGLDKKAREKGWGIYVPKDKGIARTKARLNFQYLQRIDEGE